MPAGPEESRVGGDPDVGGHAQAEAAADGRPVHGGDHRLVELAEGPDDLVEQLHRAQGDRGEGEPVDVGHDPASSRSAPEQKP